MGMGSSPLARGLLAAVAARDLDARIIPARAGFTRVRAARQARGRDHPRSRGVYVSGTLLRMGAIGSSPLARGLPQMETDLTNDYRIIPARAGFTEIESGGQDSGRDHPRSRGVYGVW